MDVVIRCRPRNDREPLAERQRRACSALTAAGFVVVRAEGSPPQITSPRPTALSSPGPLMPSSPQPAPSANDAVDFEDDDDEPRPGAGWGRARHRGKKR